MLRYERQAVLSGEVWRLLSANFLHTNLAHLGMNLLGMLLIVKISHTSLNQANFLTVLCGCALFSSLGLLLFFPKIGWYVGLSGALHGLILFMAIREYRDDRFLFSLLIAGTLFKLGYESFNGGNPLTASQIDARVLIEGHLTGAVGGMLMAIFTGLFKREPERV